MQGLEIKAKITFWESPLHKYDRRKRIDTYVKVIKIILYSMWGLNEQVDIDECSQVFKNLKVF